MNSHAQLLDEFNAKHFVLNVDKGGFPCRTCDEWPGQGAHAHRHMHFGLVLEYILNGMAGFYQGLVGR
jgi:hypothetical protein